MRMPVIVIGGGGHAKVLIDAMMGQSFKIIGITDRDKGRWGCKIMDIPVIGGDDVVLDYSPDAVLLVNGLGSAGITVPRRQIYDHFKNSGYSFASVIHPSAVTGAGVELAEGVQVMAGAIIQTGSRIGDNTIINTKASVDHDCVIGKHVHLAPGVTLSGGVCICDGVHLGTGATVIQGAKIGKNSVVGAGSLVINDIPGGVTVMGVPAKVVAE